MEVRMPTGEAKTLALLHDLWNFWHEHMEETNP